MATINGGGRPHSKTNSTDANLSQNEGGHGAKTNDKESATGDFTSAANFSQSLPDSDVNKDDNEKKEEGTTSKKDEQTSSPLMTIKEKLGRGRIHPVPGYQDSENMWQKLVNMEKDTISNVSRFPNN